MFIELSAMIVVIKRRLVFIFHLEAKQAKMDCKNEIYTSLPKLGQTWQKVNGQFQSKSTEKSTALTSWMTSQM